MWRNAEDIQDDLDSTEPARISSALETLEFHLETSEPVEVSLPRAHHLACFGDELPGEVATRLVKLLAGCQSFAPHMSQADAAFLGAEAAVRFGPTAFALEASLLVKAADDPAAVTRHVMKGLGSDRVVREAERAGDYIGFMLAGEPAIRAAVIEGLGHWTKDAERVEIISRVLGELDDEERAKVWG